jgi:membrane protein YqaA with SNARE-associated domain
MSGLISSDLNPWQAALFMAIGKFVRYGLTALAMS